MRKLLLVPILVCSNLCCSPKDLIKPKIIIGPLLISVNDNLKINHQDAFSFLISCLVLEIFIFQNCKLKLICDVIYSRIQNELYEKRISVKKASKIRPITLRLLLHYNCSYSTLLYSCKV